jgi:hypothetical protein
VLLFGPVLLIAGGISFFYPPFSFTDNTNVDIGLFTSPKYPVLTLFILMQLIYLYRRDYLLFLLSTLSIIVVYTGLILPVLMAAGIMLLLLWINKQTGFKEIAEYAIITFVFLVSTLGLIILQNDQQAVLFTDKSSYSFSGSLSVSNAVVLLRHIATYSVKFLLSLLLPLLLLCGYRLLKRQHLADTCVKIYACIIYFHTLALCNYFQRTVSKYDRFIPIQNQYLHYSFCDSGISDYSVFHIGRETDGIRLCCAADWLMSLSDAAFQKSTCCL